MRRPTLFQFNVIVSSLLAIGFLVFGTWDQALVAFAVYWFLPAMEAARAWRRRRKSEVPQ